MTQKPILIIGAGLGGLTLAQGLRRRDIPFKVYERDPTLDARLQGYRLRLNLLGLQALQATIPVDVYTAVTRTGAEFVPGLVRINALTGQDLPTPAHPDSTAPPPRPPPDDIDPHDPFTRLAMSSRLPVDRGVIRNVLLSGLHDFVEFNKAFVKYEHTLTGVIAHFADGSSSVEGSLLVGADGYKSKVTKQLVGDLVTPIDLGPRMFYGKSPLTPELERVMNSHLKYGVRVAVDISSPKPPTGPSSIPSLFVEVCRYTHENAPEDYAFWVLTDSGGFLQFVESDEVLLGKYGHAAADIAERSISHFHPSVRAVVEHQDRSLTSVWAMTCAPPKGFPPWKTDRRVTVLGDAIHPMPPTGGLAGNTAMRSAGCLVQLVASRKEASEGDGWSEEEIGEYERRMRSEAGKMVALSYAAATNRFSIGEWRPLHWDGWEVFKEEEGRMEFIRMDT
ncbi:MAG: hypothetical protein TREMPRED_003290 [Tremellales sp. Tagirdzhanova-0007]|nr:MAG: hypothetical protein TREMPRED_003290 [Tremellales sp. Tagirdzhanova-0007]